MLLRTIFRSFKSWSQYQAEKLGVTEAEYLDVSNLYKKGQYSTWKHRNEVSQKIRFLLDHCTPEEQKLYLKEFTSEDLAVFLRNELYSMTDDEVKAIDEMRVTFHALPGVNMLYKFKNILMFIGISADNTLTEGAMLRRLILEKLNLKLDELQWKKMDRQISSSI